MKFLPSALKRALFLGFLVCFLASCASYMGNLQEKTRKVDGRVVEVTEVPPKVDRPSSYAFAIVTDVHVGSKKATPPIAEFFDWLERLPAAERPLFVYSLGDHADHGYEAEHKQYKEEFADRLESMGIPVFMVLGNHDTFRDGFKFWRKYNDIGSSLYRVQTDRLSWYTFDTGARVLGEKQLNLLAEAWENDPNPKVLLTHSPIVGGSNSFTVFCDTDEIRDRFLEYCAKSNVKRMYTGHQHPKKLEVFYPCGELFPQYVIPSFTYNRQWLYVTVDEDSLTFTERVVSAGE